MDNIKEYVELVKAPWGKMFYDLAIMQLDIPKTPRLNILDFGSGLGVISNHFAEWHNVTAIEPNQEMIDHSHRDNKYTQIHGSIEKLTDFMDDSFDIIICHNVIEYIECKEPILSELLRVLNPNGILSIVKHNRVGRVLHTAVFKNDPQKALTILDDYTNDKNNYLGTQYIYSNDDLTTWIRKSGGEVVKIMGMRAFYALGQDNEIKYTDNWYQNTLALENCVAEIDAYRNAAFLNHVLIIKSEVL